MRSWILAGLLAAGPETDDAVVWIFFSPDSPDASALFEQARGRDLRPVLLVERYTGDREPSPDFLATVRAAGEVRVVDEEGLREARRLGIRELPAVAVVRGASAHVASGSKADLKELLRCPR
jgi:hypothetical protein